MAHKPKTLEKLPLHGYVAFDGVEIDDEQDTNEAPLIGVNAIVKFIYFSRVSAKGFSN